MKGTLDTGRLVAALRRGSRRAFAEAMSLYGPLVAKVTGPLLRDPRDLQEVMQDTFLHAFRAIDSFDQSRGAFATWLGRIAYNQALNHLRHNRPEELRAEVPDISDEPLTDDDDATLLAELIDRLPPEQRLLLSLVYYEQMPLAEVALIMNSDPQAMAARLYRLRNKLRKTIDEQRKI